MTKRADGIVGLDPRFNVGDTVFTANGLAYEVQDDPPRPMMSGHPGRSRHGAKFVSVDSDRIVCRFSLATQHSMLTATEANARRADETRSMMDVYDDELIPIF
jgi:hypothetical protein